MNRFPLKQNILYILHFWCTESLIANIPSTLVYVWLSLSNFCSTPPEKVNCLTQNKTCFEMQHTHKGHIVGQKTPCCPNSCIPLPLIPCIPDEPSRYVASRWVPGLYDTVFNTAVSYEMLCLLQCSATHPRVIVSCCIMHIQHCTTHISLLK